MLHSLSHLLMTAVSLECGYPASSLRERVYASPGQYGILAYTGSSDAEGTLGGLVEAGRRIREHLRHALELGLLCSNDPICAFHRPEQHDPQALLGSACHGCLLVAETSCEQHNDFLDRALVVPPWIDGMLSSFDGHPDTIGSRPALRVARGSLRALGDALREGQLSVGVTELAVRPIAGDAAAAVLGSLNSLLGRGMGHPQVALLVDALAGQKARSRDASLLHSLVLSGPDVPGVPTADTGAVMQTLITEAESEILLVGYAVHNGREFFGPLAARMASSPHLRVVMCLDISRPFHDASLSSDVVRRFAEEFRRKHWPWPRLPTVLYDPRALSDAQDCRACLHAKCVVVDRRAALITSANFTEAAHLRNIEAGVLVRHARLAARLADHFWGLQAAGQLVPCTIPPA